MMLYVIRLPWPRLIPRRYPCSGARLSCLSNCRLLVLRPRVMQLNLERKLPGEEAGVFALWDFPRVDGEKIDAQHGWQRTLAAW
jgi:hypothetical protein